jgi:hypothetical protein
VGHSLIEAPDVNMVRVYQNGRVFENYGEDPYLAGQLAEVKHYAANDQEIDRKTIHEIVDAHGGGVRGRRPGPRAARQLAVRRRAAAGRCGR